MVDIDVIQPDRGMPDADFANTRLGRRLVNPIDHLRPARALDTAAQRHRHASLPNIGSQTNRIGVTGAPRRNREQLKHAREAVRL